MTARSISISVFSIIALLVILITARVLFRVYVAEDFLIFTDEEQIGEAIDSEFGIFANYL